MDCTLEKECSALGGLFQSIVNDLKSSHPIWEDFVFKASKLQTQLKSMISAVNLFLDALQKIADVATAAKGATRDIGTALTRICMRHRSIENRLKTLTSALIDCLVQPLQEKMEDWRRTANQMDKDHAKEYKKCRHEIKKRSMDTIRLQKKVRKGQNGMQRMLESATHEVNDRYMGLLDIEKQAVRQAMVEQRGQYCLFVSWFKPVMDGEISLLNEITQLNEVVDLLYKHSTDPYSLPAASEAVIMDVKGLENTWRFQTPPSSPGSSLGSRKSSLCSLSSADSHGSAQQPQQRGYVPPSSTVRMDPNAPRFSSMSSQDSGFTSQDTLYTSRPKSPPRSIMLINNHQNSVSDEEGSTPGSLDSQQSTPSPSPSSATWPDNGIIAPVLPRNTPMTPPLQRPHTISAGYNDARMIPRRTPLNNMTFVPPRPTSLFKNSQDGQENANGVTQRPPLPQKTAGRGSRASTPMKSGGTTPSGPKMVPAIPDFNQTQPDQVLPQPIYMNVQDLQKELTKEQQLQQQIHYVVQAAQTPQQHQNHQQQLSAGGRSKRPLSFVGTDDFINLLNSECSTPLANSTSTVNNMRDDDEDTVIGECVDQIDMLTSELDRYCTLSYRSVTRTPTSSGSGSSRGQRPDASVVSLVEPYCTLPRNYRNQGRGGANNGGFMTPIASMMTNTIVRRPSTNLSKPPPPPMRRNSSITAATPNAPAVDFVRSNSRCTTPVDESFNAAAQQSSIAARYAVPSTPSSTYSQPHQGRRATVGLFHNSTPNGDNQSNYGHTRAWSEAPVDERYSFPAPPPPLSTTTNEDFSVSREILMMQIRSGVRLKSASSTPTVSKDPRDRSMPRV